MATHTHTPSTPAPAHTPTMPSTLDLARHRVGLWAKYDERDERLLTLKEPSPEHHQTETERDNIQAEIDAIEALMFARPSASMADAAALAAMGSSRANRIGAWGQTETAGLTEDLLSLERAFARIAVLLAGAAAIDLAETQADGDLDLIRRINGPVEVVS